MPFEACASVYCDNLKLLAPAQLPGYHAMASQLYRSNQPTLHPFSPHKKTDSTSDPPNSETTVGLDVPPMYNVSNLY